MAMSLYLWKAPVVDDADEAAKLVERYFAQNEEGVFEPSPDISATAEELLQLYPVRLLLGKEARAELTRDPRNRFNEEDLARMCAAGVYANDPDSPWSELPFEQSPGLLILNLRWGASDEVCDDIERLAYENSLVLYDPQGPDVHPPGERIEHGPPPAPTAGDYVKAALMAVPFAAATYGAWLIPWGWLRWPLVALGLFFTAAALFVIYAMIEGQRDPPPA